MILCRLDDDWFLTTGVNYERQICWLRSGVHMPHPQHFTPYVGGHYGAVPLGSGITFYPEVRYHGLLLDPFVWDPDGPEPILHVYASPHTMADLSDPYWQATAARVGGPFPSQILMAEAWTQPSMGVFHQSFHVDELDKVEGPPPIGPV